MAGVTSPWLYQSKSWSKFAALLVVPLWATYPDGVRVTRRRLGAFAAGVLTVFFGVAYGSFLTSIAAREELPDGNAKLAQS